MENGTVQSRTHDPVHQLSTLDSQPLTYDAKGNLTTNHNSQTYTWDFDNRMTSATVPAGASEGLEGTHSYTNDALGRRISKSVDNGGTVTTVVFVCTSADGWDREVGQVLTEYAVGAAAAQPERKLVFGRFIDEPCVFVDHTGADGTAGEDLYYYSANDCYSVAAVTDASADVIERYAYAAYGEITFFDGNGGLKAAQESDVANAYTFTGRRFDSDTELYYYRSRYYDAALGRFQARDSLGYWDGNNQYRYVRNQPTQALDPSGHGWIRTCTPWTKTVRPCTPADHAACNASCVAGGGTRGRMSKCYTFTRTCTYFCGWGGTWGQASSGGDCMCWTNLWKCVCPPIAGCTEIGATNNQKSRMPMVPCLCKYSCTTPSGKPYVTPPKPGRWRRIGSTRLY